jgi:hypothetical protein
VTIEPRAIAALGLALVAVLATITGSASAATGTTVGWGTPLQLSQFSFPKDSGPNGQPLADGNAQAAAHTDGTTTVVWTRVGGGILARTVGVDSSLPPTTTVVPDDPSLVYNTTSAAALGTSATVLSFDRRMAGGRFSVKAAVMQANGAVGNELDLGLTNVGNATPPYISAAKLVSNGDGTVTAAWTVRSGDSYVVREVQLDGHGTLGTTHDLATLGSATEFVGGGQLAVAAHDDGTASIAWYSSRSIGGQSLTTPQIIRVNKNGAMGSVVDLQPETSDPQFGGDSPQIAGHADGSTTAVWTLSAEGGFLWQIAENVVRPDGALTKDTPTNIVPPCTTESSVYYCNSSNGGPPNIVVAANGDGSTTVASYSSTLGAAAYRIDPDGSPHGDGQVNPTGPWGLDSGAPLGVRIAGTGDGNAVVVYKGSGYAFVSHIVDSNGVRPGAQTIAQGADVNVGDFHVTPGTGTQVTATWLSLVPADAWGAGTKTIAVFASQHGTATATGYSFHPTRMIALGDSYTSGQGLSPQAGVPYDCGTDMSRGLYRQDTTDPAYRAWVPGDCDTRTMSYTKPEDLKTRPLRRYENQCHRSARAYPKQLAKAFGIASSTSLFVACSGAKMRNVGLLASPQPVAQYPQSPANVAGGETQIMAADAFAKGGAPDLVTIGIGGNDAGFADIIKTCIASDCLNPKYDAQVLSRINGSTFLRLLETLTKLRVHFPSATVLAFGYPEIVGDPNAPCASVGVGPFTISHGELDWLKTQVEPAINAAIAKAASQAGAVFINISAATIGHELCSDTSDRWINGLLFGHDFYAGPIGFASESFHPNQKAHDAIARYFVNHYTDGQGDILVSNTTTSLGTKVMP